MPLGSYLSANLTPTGSLKDWSDGEIFRVIRNGIDKDGQVLFAMYGARGRHLSDDDIKAVIAYLRSAPAAGNETPKPPDQYNPLALMLMGATVIPDGEPKQFITAMRTGASPDGHAFSNQMPWRKIGRMDDEELTALYTYITQ